MKRIVIHRPGRYEALHIEEAPDLRPQAGQVLIRVQAAGVNFADCIVRMGLYGPAKRYEPYPMTPGFEVAGTVAEVGDADGDLRPGDPVMAVTRFRGYADQVVVPRAQVLRIPPGMTMDQAAGFPAVFLTAWYALFELARPRPGDAVLIHSAAGGVGSALVTLARSAGCRIAGVVGASHKVQAVRDLGADTVIDASSSPMWPAAAAFAPAGYSAVFDANGPSTLAQSYRHLAPTGRLVVYGFHSMLPRRGGRAPFWRLAWGYLRTPRFNPFRLTEQNRSVMGFNLCYLFDRLDVLQPGMRQLVDLYAAGSLRLPAVTTYPWDQAAAAHADLESGRTIGKLVLRVR